MKKPYYKALYLSKSEYEYLKSLVEAQDPHDMLGELEPEIAHYEESRLSITRKLER
ncbi:hypothetical protein GRF59_14405 [Paenibacillus sp. HJL G12]|uniref:Uncharacterized protein n=1 Tax=Paenibacillus dendrobii TaxID=2691084 RepID=A0A7X3LIZ1_9BACL|nr:hypothetical protein [Paenibacillus dendrobii]MWV44809.1 hypothetical protein [Paenibacillus dendrobii]